MPPPQRVKPARKSTRFRVADGSPRPRPLHPEPVGSGPQPHAPKNGRSGVGERRSPDAPHPGKRRTTPGTLVPPPQRAKPARKSARCGGSDGSQRPRPTQPQPVGTGPRPHTPKDGRSGVGERPTPDAPHTCERHPPPPGALVPPPQHARARAVGLVTGLHAHNPRADSQWVVGPGGMPQRTGGWGWESTRPGTPHTQARGAPPPGALVPPRQCATSGEKGTQAAAPPAPPRHRNARDARAGPKRGTHPQARQGGNGTAPTPKASQTGHGTEAGHAEGHGPCATALAAPSTRTARGTRATPTRGGGRGAEATRARVHAHAKDTRGIREGQPDRAHGTHRLHGMARTRDTWTGRPATHSAGDAGREGGNGEDTKPGTGPNPPEPAASAAHTRTVHCTRQGSSGAQRHIPAPRLGSLRASRRASHRRQASSTGPAAPAPRATTH